MIEPPPDVQQSSSITQIGQPRLSVEAVSHDPQVGAVPQQSLSITQAPLTQFSHSPQEGLQLVHASFVGSSQHVKAVPVRPQQVLFG